MQLELSIYVYWRNYIHSRLITFLYEESLPRNTLVINPNRPQIVFPIRILSNNSRTFSFVRKAISKATP